MFERIQIIAIISSFFFLGFIINLIRRKQIKEAYSILWLGFVIIFLFFSFWKRGLDFFAALVGIYYPPAFLFLILILAIIFILVQYSIVVSKQNEQIRKIVQEIAILKSKIEKNE